RRETTPAPDDRADAARAGSAAPSARRAGPPAPAPPPGGSAAPWRSSPSPDRRRGRRAPASHWRRADRPEWPASAARGRGQRTHPPSASAPASASPAASGELPQRVGLGHRKKRAGRGDAEHALAANVALLAERDEVVEQSPRHFRPKLAAHVQIRPEAARYLWLEAQRMGEAGDDMVIDIGTEGEHLALLVVL